MPEGPEIRIMSDFINQNTKDKIFTKLFHVEKGNIPHQQNVDSEFIISSDFNGKELIFSIHEKERSFNYSVFMGMSGNWKWVDTKDWNSTKYIRLRCDSVCGKSLLLYGSYMGPKFRIGGFTGVKRGPDIVKDFDNFKINIEKNLHKKTFDRPICETLLDQKYFNGVGAYLTAEIIGRLDVDPFKKIKDFNSYELENLFSMILKCCRESYVFGGGELLDWQNPFGQSKIYEWILFYNNRYICYKQKFGKRNIWIQNKFKQH